MCLVQSLKLRFSDKVLFIQGFVNIKESLFMTDSSVTVFSNLQNTLGESPLWHPLLNTLFWVDIEQNLLLSKRLSPEGEVTQVKMLDTVSALAWLDEAHLIIGTSTGIYKYHVASGVRQTLILLENTQLTRRANDGRADPWGGFWLSTMDRDAHTGEGKIYRFYQNSLKCVIEGLTIPNGLCFDKARSRAYYCDSKTSCIFTLNVNQQSGEPILPARVFYQFKNTQVDPDGCVIDAQGNLWLAVWNLGCVMCLSPQGEVIKTQPVAAIKPTSVVFGGSDAQWLFVTSADDSKVKTNQSLQGNVFKITGIQNGQLEPPVII